MVDNGNVPTATSSPDEHSDFVADDVPANAMKQAKAKAAIPHSNDDSKQLPPAKRLSLSAVARQRLDALEIFLDDLELHQKLHKHAETKSTPPPHIAALNRQQRQQVSRARQHVVHSILASLEEPDQAKVREAQQRDALAATQALLSCYHCHQDEQRDGAPIIDSDDYEIDNEAVKITSP